jgi:hypothetical protein
MLQCIWTDSFTDDTVFFSFRSQNELNWVYSILGMCSVFTKLTQLKLNLLFWSLYPTMSTCTSEHIWIYCFDPLHIQLRVLVLLLQGFLSNELVKACDIICQRLALWPHPLADRWESNSLSRCQASCISQLTLEDTYCRSMADKCGAAECRSECSQVLWSLQQQPKFSSHWGT